MTLNPSTEINTNDLPSRGGVTSLYKVREKRKKGAKLASTHIARKKVPQLFFGVLLCFFVFLHMRKCEHLALPLSAAHSWVTDT